MRILVIEDEPRILAFVSRGLEAEGFTVDAAGDGPGGLRRAVVETYDLVVLDLLLPRLDGLAVLRELQRRRPGLPVVIVSARGDLETKLRGFALRACDYVAKPFSFDELLARIRAQLRRGQWGGDGTVVSAGALTLDVARRQAKLGEVVAVLSDVWGYHFDPRSNVVDVCVRRLRKKLGPEAPIETVRHGGYRLAPA